jgi:hypothetical protein
MTYTYKVWPELGWAVFVGVAVTIGTELLTFDASVLDKPEAWIAGIVAGAARAVGAAVLSVFRPGGTSGQG